MIMKYSTQIKESALALVSMRWGQNTHKAFQGKYILLVDLNWIDPQVGLKPTTPCPISYPVSSMLAGGRINQKYI